MFRVSRPREILLITALCKPGTTKPVTIEKFRMARITPSKAAPCGCDTWPGQGCARPLVDAIAPLYACAHWKPMHINVKGCNESSAAGDNCKPRVQHAGSTRGLRYDMIIVGWPAAIHRNIATIHPPAICHAVCLLHTQLQRVTLRP